MSVVMPQSLLLGPNQNALELAASTAHEPTRVPLSGASAAFVRLLLGSYGPFWTNHNHGLSTNGSFNL